MRYISLFSGIEAASVAWAPLGWEPVAFSEIEKFPCSLLAERFPDVPNDGDITKVDWKKYAGEVDVVIGGSPCQSFSVAGLRRGLMDPRGNLMLEYLRAISEIKPRWLIWENVPGVLSADGGAAFGTMLGALAELGYGFTYRVLDAQFYGVAQRRRRVFVVGYFGDWRYSAAVLFERGSLSGNTKTSREKRKELADRFGTGSAIAIAGNIIGRDEQNGGNGIGCQKDVSYTLTSTDLHGVYEYHSQDDRVVGPIDCSKTLDTRPDRSHLVAFAQNERDEVRLINGDGSIVSALATSPGMKQQSFVAGFISHGSESAQGIGFEIEQSPTLMTSKAPAIASIDCRNFSLNDEISGTLQAKENGGYSPNAQNPVFCMAPGWQQGASIDTDLCPTQTATQSKAPPLITAYPGVRRLMPVECERLQGFPDGYTQIGNTADTPRYRTLGNSMAVPVIRWIGRRIVEVERVANEKLRVG